MGAFKRVYMDLPSEIDSKAETRAKIQGKTKKAYLENLINEDIKRATVEAQTAVKRSKKIN